MWSAIFEGIGRGGARKHPSRWIGLVCGRPQCETVEPSLASAMAGMDIVYSVQQYVSKMTEGVSGMKALLLDKETTGVVSMVCSRSQVLEKEVFLFQRLDAQRRGQVLSRRRVCRPQAARHIDCPGSSRGGFKNNRIARKLRGSQTLAISCGAQTIVPLASKTSLKLPDPGCRCSRGHAPALPHSG